MPFLAPSQVDREPAREVVADIRSHPVECVSIARRPLAWVFGAASAIPPLTGAGGVWTALALLFFGGLIASAIVPATPMSGGRLTLIHWWPISTLFGILASTAVGLVAAWAGTPFWAGRASAMLTWGLLIGVFLAVALRRSGQIPLAPNRSSMITPVALSVVFLAILAQPFEVWARLVNRGTDFSRHAVMVVEAAQQGWLDYAGNPYPRSVHSALGLVQAAAGDTSYSGSWQATEGMLIILFCLLTVGSALLASRLMEILGGPRWLSAYLVPGLVTLLMISGPWVADMMPDGYVTSFQAGLILTAAATLFLDGRPKPSVGAVVGLVALSSLMAHSWLLLLPVVALPTVWLVASHVRSRTSVRLLVVSCVMGAAIAAPVVLASIFELGLGATKLPGGTLLPMFGLAWIALLSVSCLGVALLARRGANTFATACVLMVLPLIGLLAFLIAASDGSTGSHYWIQKTAWTPFALLLALSVPTMIWGAWRAWRRQPSGTTALSAAKPARMASAIAVLAALGLVLWQPIQIAESRSVLQSHTGFPPLTIPVIEQLDALSGTDSGERPQVVVWGLSPYLDSDVRGVKLAGNLDYIAQTALIFAGYPGPDELSQHAVFAHDPVALCQTLERSPGALRVTGPVPEAALAWLSESGCPADVVQPERWVSINLDPDWYRGTRYESVPFGADYASWTDVQGIVAELKGNPELLR